MHGVPVNDKARQRLDPNFFWLIAGCILLLFMGGKWNILIATWVGSIFFVRYFRMQRSSWGILLALPFILVASHFFFLGLAVQVTVAFQILIAVSYTLYVMVPCLVDRLLYRKLNSPLLATLVYPASLIVVQFLLSYIEALGTVLNWTGPLFSLKPLIQLVSITGVWGPSFLVGWFASLANTLWENQFDLKKVKLPVVLWSTIVGAAMLWGGMRMVFFAPAPGTVKVGSVVVGLPEDNLFYTYLELDETAQLEQKEKYREWSREVQDKLFATSEQLIPSGIKILTWASGNAVVFAEDEAQLIQRMQDLAREHQIYFFPSLLVLGEYKGPDRNRVLAIRPDGQIAYTHFKGRNPNAGFYQGNAIEVIDTPYGRIASPICFEMEFHRFIRQVGENKVDILIVPGDEPSKDNAIVHTELSMFRCIENGCSIVRTTLEGLTMGMDYQGRVLAQMNYYLTLDNRTLITELPVHGVQTLYSRWGDWFAYVCMIVLAFCAAVGIRNVVKGFGAQSDLPVSFCRFHRYVL
jgi:apolipoprotein N-acyltransferase